MQNKKIYIVSVCMKKLSRLSKNGKSRYASLRGRQAKKFSGDYEFHFKGYYHGKKVESLVVLGGDFEPYEEYILHARVTGFKEGTLFCRCLRYKSIFNH